MKLFRFMSKEEFNKYLKGEELINEIKHIGNTNSKGFCFMNLEDYYAEIEKQQEEIEDLKEYKNQYCELYEQYCR